MEVCSIQWGKPLQNLVLIKDGKYAGWENLMALKVIRLYLNKMRYVIGMQGCSLHTEEFSDASQVLEVTVTGMTNLGYVTGKGVSRVQK